MTTVAVQDLKHVKNGGISQQTYCMMRRGNEKAGSLRPERTRKGEPLKILGKLSKSDPNKEAV